jgi:hypothetical protein
MSTLGLYVFATFAASGSCTLGKARVRRHLPVHARMGILEGSRPGRLGAALRSGERSTAAPATGRVRGDGCPRRPTDLQDTGNTFWESEEVLRASEGAANRIARRLGGGYERHDSWCGALRSGLLRDVDLAGRVGLIRAGAP